MYLDTESPTLELDFTRHDNLATDATMPLLLLALENADEIAVDTETTGLNVRNGVDYMQGLCYSTGTFSGYIPFRHRNNNVSPQWIQPVFDVLSTKTLIWHNLKFDFHSLRTLGVDPLSLQGTQHDTLLIAHEVDEELPSKELDWLCKKFLNDSKAGGETIKKLGGIYGWGAIPPVVMAPYGAYDAYLTFRLFKYLWSSLVQQELEEVYRDTEIPFAKLLYKMEKRGVGVNKELATAKAERGRGRMSTIHKKVGFNPGSTKDLNTYLIDGLGLPVLAHTDSCPKCGKKVRYKQPLSTHTWKPSFNKHVMEDYDDILQASNDPTARLVGEYRGWQKAVTSLYEPLIEKTGPDGRIRTEFKQHGTVTKRLSAANPNLQQVPRGSDKPWNGDAKACFISGEPGKILIGWDYSQIELRLAAAYGREQILLTEFEREGADPFNVLAPLIFGILTPETRQDTKTFVYANLFGAGLSKIAATLGRPEEEVKPLFDKYKDSISGITEVSQRVTNATERRGWVKYWDNSRRHIRDKSKAYKAWNSVIQGGAAQLTKNSMLRADQFCNDDCEIVLTVHDEITFLITEDAIPDYEPKIVTAMTDWPKFNVKLAVEGKEWGKVA